MTTTHRTIRSIAVYCGSSPGNNPAYVALANDLADYFVEKQIRLINGGGSIGLMGVMADRMLKHDGVCIGVIPLALKDKEVAHTGMSELIVVPDMHARKLIMVNLSDAFIAIPGGFGTLDEIFETLTWSQLHLHNKPVGLLNINGYFDPLLAQLDHMVEEGFLKAEARALLYTADRIEELMEKFTSHIPPSGEKWDYMRQMKA